MRTSGHRLEGVMLSAQTLTICWIERCATITTLNDVIGEQAIRW
jgi:hypothetical protein